MSLHFLLYKIERKKKESKNRSKQPNIYFIGYPFAILNPNLYLLDIIAIYIINTNIRI